MTTECEPRHSNRVPSPSSESLSMVRPCSPPSEVLSDPRAENNALTHLGWVHCLSQCSVPSAAFALESYAYEAPQSQTRLESCELSQDSQRCGKACWPFCRACRGRPPDSCPLRVHCSR